ncbi:S41 family peptidase [Pedobacter faecalis]|uniref:S41 family peptidase n=1 Tax=Pedobacter faecalis TaxID=3041495 RepID=UPI00254DDD53|nr:S41 family peptidase [Pedobacter sp. ELA7]
MKNFDASMKGLLTAFLLVVTIFSCDARQSTRTDTTFAKGSNIKLASLSPQQVSNLAFLGQFWGFLKYHHPSVAKGAYNWDFELFRMLPGAIAAKNNEELSKSLEAYLEGLPKPASCPDCGTKSKKRIALNPDYGELFNGKIANASLTEKLNYIRDNRHLGAGYYIAYASVGNPDFRNENDYADMSYPDAGYRLLSLYRYWAMINYFFPYKDQIDQDWNEVLKDFIPAFVQANDERAYVVATTKLIAKISDTHANLWGSRRAVNLLKGDYLTPVQAKFIENKLIVTGFYTDTLGLKSKMKIGEEIVAINGRTVPELVKAYLPMVAASNYDTQLRDLPFNFLLRGHEPSMKLTVRGDKGNREVMLNMLTQGFRFTNIDYTRPGGYELIDGNIGYVYPAKYKNTDLPAIKKLFANAQSIVVDMRCYPSDFMPFTFGNYIKKKHSPFVNFTRADLQRPGEFSFADQPLKNGGGGQFSGNVIVIVDASSQSNAEYTTMAFQSAANVRVLGSTTAGADGNVSRIVLPGGLSTMISGIGIFYPDGTRTQRVGVKIDYPMKPTIKGIQQGKDELLDRAIELLRKGW